MTLSYTEFLFMNIPNLLIIAGTGNKSGKTSIACRIIESFPELNMTAIKITPHFHETTEGLIVINEGDGYSIYLETNRESNKDTSRMLKAGAEKVYFAEVWDNKLLNAFSCILEMIPEGTPIICESPALRDFTAPGVFIIMSSDTMRNKKNIKHLQDLPHLSIKLEDLTSESLLPVCFENGKWEIKKL
jgi:hypothetical protein